MVTITHPLPGITPNSGGLFGVCRPSGGDPCGRKHQGIDLTTSSGTPIRAAAGGIVTQRGQGSEAAGISVRILHSDGWQTRYLHLREDSKLPYFGKPIQQGEIVGLVGDTGNAIVPHLHFELITLTGHVDPLPYLTGEDVTFLPPDSPGSPNPIDWGLPSVKDILANLPFRTAEEFEALPCDEIEALIIQLKQGEELSKEELLELLGLKGKVVLSPQEAELFSRIRNKIVSCGLHEKGLFEAFSNPILGVLSFFRMIFSLRGLYFLGGGIITISGGVIIWREIR